MSENKYDDKIVTSHTLTDELNKEREKQGLSDIGEINCVSASTNTYARRNKSFSSVPDFFKKLIKKDGKRKDNGKTMTKKMQFMIIMHRECEKKSVK